MMTEVDATELQKAVETIHSCTATLAQTIPVKEEASGSVVWEGVVHVFDIKGHPDTMRCYAWSSPIEGSDKRQFFAILKIPPIESPIDAVRAAIVAENKGAQ
jgi:hypothetical protein